MSEEFISAKDLAKQLGISEITLAQWRCRGVGPAFVRVGTRAIRYARTDVDAWLAARKVGGATVVIVKGA